MNTNQRFTLGIILIAVGCLMPFGVYPVARADWPAYVKTAVGGVLFFHFCCCCDGEAEFRAHRGKGKIVPANAQTRGGRG